MYAVIVCVSVFVAPLVARRVGKSSSSRALAQCAVAGSVFAVLAFVFGPTGFDIPGTRVRGIFFAEWKFVTFFFYVGLPVALTTATTAFLSRNSTRG